VDIQKVWAAKPSRKVDKNMLDATVRWKFIPAFKNGRAVACRAHLSVSFNQ
jgi:ABC-type Fe3+-hydroxamate transport system substrate-binding protein